jgi:hypothetical protein
MPRVRWTLEEEERLLNLIAAGKSWTLISGMLKRSMKSVKLHAKTLRPLGAKKTRAEGKMTVRVLLLLAAISFSATKVGNKPLVQVKPKEPTGCKLVGTVKGTKLWAGDCVASELRGATETKPLSEQDIEAIPPGQKQ